MTTDNITPVEIPAVGTYRIDPSRSTVSYSSRHMLGLGVVHATFTIGSGELVVADPPTASTVDVSIAAGSFNSSNARRDKDVRGARLLDVATFPVITVTSSGLRQDSGHWLLAGSVTAHGSTVPVEVTVDRATAEGDGIRVHAKAERLDPYTFGITASKGMVGRYLDLDLDVFAAAE
ncbi:MAG: YceI family protein [Geodermatophilaceae bacterium]|nr:YceI family protein [Geodermatophilaceae bacterium]